MRPDANQHRPDAAYLRRLAAASGMSVRELARVTGIEHRRLRRILDGSQPARYPEQFAIESIARNKA